ncbi:hypothetical protein E2C01_079704 [Portunus trituberculatus]|uniref:Uncharacterized protein n=1 Tax=Portunus trituberculatus TaxID=210409 RepID=A0A5B7IK89_PORTR|nr:hypothetical protein [Portunus trituberculatus]
MFPTCPRVINPRGQRDAWPRCELPRLREYLAEYVHKLRDRLFLMNSIVKIQQFASSTSNIAVTARVTTPPCCGGRPKSLVWFVALVLGEV